MKLFLIGLGLLGVVNHVYGQACWSEWEYKDDWLLRANLCVENVSMPDTQPLCWPYLSDDTIKTAERCPESFPVFFQRRVVVEPIEFRCMNFEPPGAGGSYNQFYYGISKKPSELDILRDLCTQFGGSWQSIN